MNVSRKYFMHWVVTYFIRSIGCLSVEADGGTTGEKYIPSTSEDPIWLPVFFYYYYSSVVFCRSPSTDGKYSPNNVWNLDSPLK